MKRTFTGLAVALSALVGGLPASRAGEDASGTPLSVLLENIEGTAGTESTSGPRARVTLSGEAAHLPDGTLLHVSLMVSDRHPPVEAGFFRVTVQGGKYGGNHEWEGKTFAPLAYRTEVRLIMEVQNPSVKRFLARELGYPAQHVEVVSAVRTLLGTEEERSAFQVQTLRTLRDYQQRLITLHAALQEKVGLDPNGPEFAEFTEAFVPRLRDVRDELTTWEKTRVVWYDAAIFSALGQALFQVSWAFEQLMGGDAESVRAGLGNVATDLRRLQDGIDSRLPVEPGQDSGGSR